MCLAPKPKAPKPAPPPAEGPAEIVINETRNRRASAAQRDLARRGRESLRLDVGVGAPPAGAGLRISR